MATYESIAANVARISAAVKAATSAVSSYVAGNVAAAETSYNTAQNLTYGSTDASLAKTSSSANSVASSVTGSINFVQDEAGRWRVVAEDTAKTPINDSIFSGNNYYQQSASYAAGSTTAVLDQTEGILSGIEGWIADAIKGAIAGVEDLIRPILLTVETALALLGDTMLNIADKITSIPEMINEKLTELLSFDEERMSEYVDKMIEAQQKVAKRVETKFRI